MMAELHRQQPTLLVIQGDAHRLPFRNQAMDVVAFVTTIEFLDNVELAVSEALRVARQGILLIVLNRLSVGGFSRRFGSQMRGSLLGQARDYSVGTLRRLIRQVGGKHIRGLTWRCTLFPIGLWSLQAPIPFGDVIGMAVVLNTA
jgi:ubiquinone/menaquinone biosynthesis C-methylase UbiE